MADGESGGTVGVWIPEDSDVVDEFDDVVGNRIGPGDYYRSEQIREAMRLYTELHRTMDELGWPVMGSRDRLAAVRQALRDMDAREES